MLIRTDAIYTSISRVYTSSPASIARVNTARTISPGQMIRAFNVQPEQTPSCIGTNFAAILDTFSKIYKHGLVRDVIDFSHCVIIPRQGRYRIQFH
jgi:hypothetical protein